MRRTLGLFLVVFGLVASIVGAASGCGSLFSFNGRHPIAVYPLTPGAPIHRTIPAKSGTRYTLAVQVLFEREGLLEESGALVVEAHFPLLASLERAKAVGWLDPNEPPTVLYGQSTNPNVRRPRDAGAVELVAERLVGPFLAPFEQDLGFDVDLGPDRLAKARVKEARVIVYDDRLPTSLKVAFAAASGGVIALVSGTVLLLLGFLRKRRGGAQRRQNV